MHESETGKKSALLLNVCWIVLNLIYYTSNGRTHQRARARHLSDKRNPFYVINVDFLYTLAVKEDYGLDDVSVKL